MAYLRDLCIELRDNCQTYVERVVDLGQDQERPDFKQVPEGASLTLVFFDTPTEPVGVAYWSSCHPDCWVEPSTAVEDAIDRTGYAPEQVILSMYRHHRGRSSSNVED